MYKQLSQEYMDLDTLENGLHYMPKRRSFSSHNSSSICTMVPTPGVSDGGNPNYMVTSSGDAASGRNGIAHSTANNGSISPSGSGLFINNSGFTSADGYHGGNNMTSSAGIQTINQMIPTPGFNGNTCQPYMNVETSSAGGCFANVESKVVSQQQQQQHRKQHTAGQNSGIMHNRGIQMGNGNRSTKHQKAYGFSNGNLNGNVRMNGHSMQNMTEPGTLEGCFSGTPYGNSSKPLSQHFDQQQMLPLAGDRYNIGSADPSWIGNFYGNGSTSGSVMSSNLNPVSLQSISNINSPVISNQPNLLRGKQAAQMNSQSTDQSDKMDIRIPVSTRDTVLQSPQEQPTKAHQQQQFVQNQYTQKQLSQQQHLSIKKESFESQLTSNPGSQVKVEKLGYHSKFHTQGHAQFQNELNCVPSFAKSESLMQSQWHPQPQSQDQSLKQGALVPEPHIHEESRHRITGHVEAQRNNLLVEGSMVPLTAASVSTVEHLRPSGTACRSINANHERLLTLQRKWLFYLHHARRCQLPEGKCYEQNCVFVQNLCRHIEKCSSGHCPRPRCLISKKLIQHFTQCRDPHCPVCAPVKSRYLKEKVKAHTRQGPESGVETPTSTAFKPHDSKEQLNKASVKTLPVAESCEYLHPMKRMKTEQSSQYCLPDGENSLLFAPITKDPHNTCNVPSRDNQLGGICTAVKPESMEVEVDGIVKPIKDNYHSRATKEDSVDDTFHGKPNVLDELPGLTKQENIKPEKMIEPELQHNVTLSAEQTGSGKSGKPNIKGVSMTELFTPEQVREHISGLRQWVGQSKAKAEKNQAMKHSMSENCCQLCAVERLTFEPPPTYCSPCGGRIKRNAMYYSIGTGETRNFFCIPCYNDARGDTVKVDGRAIPKIKLEKRKNDEETEEWWVQCDKCEAWQHQICALFNGRRNEGGQAEYTCPNCYIVEVEKGERSPLPQSAVLGAKDLPRTILSDQIEQRLFRKLKQERQERANRLGKSYDEVPGAESLVVRVVSSVDKKLEVKQRFLEIFREENYPKEYPYKSKVVLLFQKIEGVEVCLFGMYVQEFGSECELPNQRRVYLSYLDSVKYFRPEIKAVTGEALRTFVYHEILIGYLEYCKKRGFTSCYIWACPPLKGEDYILYCHPEIQKTPKSDKLREWYLSMLRKASEENIVVDLTNLHDHFFLSTGECKTKVTAARLPYFDGDYWPGSAEDLIYQMQQEEDGTKFSRKGLTKKTISKRALKASGHTDLSGSTPKDLLLMHKLGETISPMKEDFIMVHLQHACTHCCTLMVSGNRWVCKQCKKFQLCDKCYDVERKFEDRDRHPIHHRDAHALFRVEITDVPEDTKDKDETLESEFFDTRQAFLSLCQGNHYQYDTLRRAKHSSMMVLYHLHNPTAPAFVTTCHACRLDIESGQGWRCEVCPDFDVCNNCYQKDGGINHPHKLTNNPSLADRDAQNTEARQLRVLQLRKMLDLLVHASQCRSMACKYPSCRKVKGLFRHGMQCRQRAAGGCGLCKKMWYLLQIHARSCKESECNVPRCSDLREHMKRLQQQAESRRRAAVMEMMRQRAAEVAAGNS